MAQRKTGVYLQIQSSAKVFAAIVSFILHNEYDEEKN
jgi:hypothetical protein